MGIPSLSLVSCLGEGSLFIIGGGATGGSKEWL